MSIAVTQNLGWHLVLQINAHKSKDMKFTIALQYIKEEKAANPQI